MKLEYKKIYGQTQIKEDYSKFEINDVISIFSKVCDIIDSHELAFFNVFFSNLDQRFSSLTFAYDFESIAIEIQSFIGFLENKENSFDLFFYELDRKVCFYMNGEYVRFEIFNTPKTKSIAKGYVKYENLYKMIKNLYIDFKYILEEYFPKAFFIFKKEDYLI